MSQNLQSILNLLQQSPALTAEEIESITKYIRATTILLAETIEELEGKRKAVETQNHELEIEAALERVRTIAMGMNKAEDMLEVCKTISHQLELLNVKEIRNVQTAIFYKDKGTYMNYEYYAKHDKTFVTETMYGNNERHAAFAEQMQKGNGESIELNITDVDEWIAYQKTTNVFIDDFLYSAHSLNYYWYSLGPVALGISTYQPLKETDKELFNRFLKVFELAYRRYLDIEQAEAQAREAQIEAALERVRSIAMGMMKSDDLLSICEAIFVQLATLGFPGMRSAQIHIRDDEKEEFVNYDYADNLGANIMRIKYSSHFYVKYLYDAIKDAGDALVASSRDEKELQEWRSFLYNTLGQPAEEKLDNATELHYYLYSFGKGAIGISSFTTLTNEDLEILKRFRNVFSFCYQRYSDISLAEEHALQAQQDLIEIKAARKKAEDTLSELLITQKQLIQSEKMASLGELTAGIAHEIQNPLNFVNNFSEVTNELIKELEEEREKAKNERDEQLEDEILADIKQNLEKINHHGKRADAIVKGMLQHSRKSEGKKEPTDINALCDEYLRLSYHGLRAKDKSFNAEFKTDFDKDIGKINVIPQDIGRVILNILTNAFYAVGEKIKTYDAKGNDVYRPTVTVETKKAGDKVQIKITDNGNGIPQQVIDKIFQPFFTTKPTGHGTGLGLSISYDIIKTYGGEIKIETADGEGAIFIITLPIEATTM